jgi:hypothetical protein
MTWETASAISLPSGEFSQVPSLKAWNSAFVHQFVGDISGFGKRAAM